MLQFEVFVWKISTVNGFTASTVVVLHVLKTKTELDRGTKTSDVIHNLQLEAYSDSSTRDILYREVAALTHKTWDNAMKRRAFVAETLLPGAQAAEVLCSLWDDVLSESHYDATELFRSGLDIKENFLWHAAKDLWDSAFRSELPCSS